MIEDIASLLLMVHETYIEPFGGKEELKGLLSFLRDSGLLCNKYLSIIETERIRLKVMEGHMSDSTTEADNSNSMDCSRFYYWLRDIANLVYEDTVDGGRGALHKLLMNHIYPASTAKERSRNRLLQTLSLYDGSITKWILQTDDFLRWWYCTMTLGVSICIRC